MSITTATATAATTPETSAGPAVDVAPQTGTSAPATVEELALRLAELEATNAQLLREKTTIQEFKDSVRSVARRYAREHDWCSVVSDALGELGVETSRTYDFDALVRVSIGAELLAETPVEPKLFIRQSLSVGEDGESVELTLDDDWDELEIRDVCIESIQNVSTR